MKRIITLLLALVIALSLCACGGGSNATATNEILQGHSWGETGNESRSIGDASSFYGLSVKSVYYKGNDWDGNCTKLNTRLSLLKKMLKNSKKSVVKNLICRQWKKNTMRKTQGSIGSANGMMVQLNISLCILITLVKTCIITACIVMIYI